MFVTVLTYRARAGEEDAIVALHEDWQRRLRSKATGYISGELLSNPRDLRLFIDISRYESEAACHSIGEDPEQDAWYRRLVSLVEQEPEIIECLSEWEAGPVPAEIEEHSAPGPLPRVRSVARPFELSA